MTNAQIRRPVAGLASALLLAFVLAGCGGNDGGSGSTSDTGAAAPSSAAATPAASYPSTTLPTATAPGDISTTTTSSALPVPSDGPTEVANFPVPRGVKVKGPGAQAKSWQFDITTKDTESVLAFYRKALTDAGYQVKTDVNETIGIEKVHYDIEFGGPAEGYIVADPKANDVFVLVESLPAAQ